MDTYLNVGVWCFCPARLAACPPLLIALGPHDCLPGPTGVLYVTSSGGVHCAVVGNFVWKSLFKHKCYRLVVDVVWELCNILHFLY